MASPFSSAIAKLASGQSITIQVFGDSTAWGYGDTGWSPYTTPWTPPPARGWPGRLGVLLGQQYNATVNVWTWNYPTDNGYDNFITLYTGTSGATITIYNGGWPGGTMANLLSVMSELLPVASPDIVIGYDGFNDLNGSATTFANNYATFVDQLQSTYCPGAPIVVTDQNGTPGPYAPSGYNTMLHKFLPSAGTGFMSPPLQQATLYTNTWVLDSQQVPLLGSDIAVGVHPGATGYQKIAVWMVAQMASAISSGSEFIRTTMGTPTGIAPGKGGLTLPANWKPGDVFTAQDENNVTGTLNALIAAIAGLGGPSLPTVPSGWAAGSVLTAGDENAVVTAINSCNAAVGALHGPTLPNVSPIGADWTADDENGVEAAVNALYAAVTTLSGG